MVSGVINAIMVRASVARVLGVLVVSCVLATIGCGKLVGDVKIDTMEPADASPSVVEYVRPPCLAGQLRCQGPVLQACEADGSGWTPRERCASAALCVDRAGEPSRCLEPICEPGVTCSGAELRECNVDRSAFETIDTCLSAAHCDAMTGACEADRCIPGEVTCNGATLQRCNDGPTGHDAIAACATAAICDDLLATTCAGNAQGCDVDGAICPEPTCALGQLRCSGTRLEICNAGRDGWDFVDECVTAGVCEATLGNPAALSCIEPICDVGEVFCSAEGARLECNLERTAYSVEISRCQRPEDCTPATCQADPCTVGELSCNGVTLQECQAPPGGGRPSRVAVQDCATRQLCEQSLTRPLTGPPVCAPPPCAAGEFTCAGRQMQVCNAGRTDFVNFQLCATDGLCQAGAGLGACPTPCSGAACNGSMLRKCNAQLTALEDKENCGTAAQCDSVAGRCTDPCVPGAVRCNGNALERCENPLQGWQRLQTCVTAGLCQASVAQNRTSCAPVGCNVGDHRCQGQELQVCNAELTGFVTQTTCGAGQICDALNQQCDICPSNATRCSGDVFSRCSANGQSESAQQCGAGLCSASGPNVGCLQCATPNGFRCDNQGSLFQCSSNQQQENQLDVCRTPQLCRSELGRCLDCSPVGSSRCEGAQVLSCSAQNTEVVAQVCDTADLCQASGSSASCGSSQCSGPLQCTNQGEVLVCNAGQTGYVAQSPRVFCATDTLCDATRPDGCRPPACDPGQRQCDGAVVEVCNAGRDDFVPETTCNAGFACVQAGASASCACTPGSYRCVAGQGLVRCNGAGTAFADVAGDIECDGADRVSCSGTTLSRDTCASSAQCLASSGATCAACTAGDCPSDGLFCNGTESCNPAAGCQSSGNPCGAGLLCSEGADSCVQCLQDSDCAPAQACTGGECVGDSADGGT
jgi:hypothetical protein